MRVVAMETIEDLVEDSRKIPTISKLNNFAFHDDRSYWKRHQQVTVNENICWGFIYLLFIGIFLVSNYKLCFTTGHHLKFLANSVQLIW